MEEQSRELRSNLINYVRRKFHGRAGVYGLAEDIVQQSFLRTPPDKWDFPYMATVCTHEAYRCFRALDQEEKLLITGKEYLRFGDGQDAVKALMQKQDSMEILDALKTLREIEQTVIIQRYYGQCSFAEIANKNGLKLNTVLSHHRRALDKLRPRMAAYSGEKNARLKTENGIAESEYGERGGNKRMTQKETFEFRILAERAHRLSFDIAMQSGQLGEDGHGIAVVAEECRSIGIRLKNAADSMPEQARKKKEAEKAVSELEMLAVNGVIEALRVSDSENGAHCSRQLAVIFDELRSLTVDIRSCMGQEPPEYRWLEAEPKNSVLHKRMPFLLMRINGVEYTENVRLVNEVMRDICDGKALSVRGRAIPVADISKLPGTQRISGCTVILKKGFGNDGIFALPVDCLPTVFWSNPGVSTDKGVQLRDCWSCSDGGMMRFLNYSGLLPLD